MARIVKVKKIDSSFFYKWMVKRVILISNQSAKLSEFFAWDFVNNLDSFYRGYYRFLMFFSNSSGDKYPIEE